MAEKKSTRKPAAKKTASKPAAKKSTSNPAEPKAPEAVEPKPVTVQPADQSVPNTPRMTIGGHEYEVTPERGRRRV